MSKSKEPQERPSFKYMPMGVGVHCLYTNYKGETRVRQITPIMMWFGSTEFHPEPQWLLQAVDVEKNQIRDFALKDMRPVVRD